MASGPLATTIIGAVRDLDEPWHIIGLDSNPLHIHAADVDTRILVPRIKDPKFLPVIRKIIDETQPDFFWPLHDDEMPMFVAMDDLNVRTFLPELPFFELTQDKMLATEHYKSHGVPVPETVLINDRSDLENAFDSLGGELWLRAIRGAGAKGAFKTDNLKSAVSWMELHDGWGSFNAAEVVPGDDVLVETIWNEGELIFAQTRTRPEGNSGAISRGSRNRRIGRTGAPDAVREVGIKAIKSVTDKPHGIMFVDQKLDANGVPRVTEINAGRFPMLGSPTWRSFGFNSVGVVLKLVLGEPLGFEAPAIEPLPHGVLKLSGIEFPTSFLRESDTLVLKDDLEKRIAEL